MFTDVGNSCSHGRPILHRKCFRGKELRAGRLFARRPPGGTEEDRNAAASAYAVRSWKKRAVWRVGRKNFGPAKKITAKARRTRSNDLTQSRQGVYAFSYENSPLSLRERARVRALSLAGASTWCPTRCPGKSTSADPPQGGTTSAQPISFFPGAWYKIKSSRYLRPS